MPNLDVASAIRQRVSTKMLGDPATPLPARTEMRDVLPELIALAGQAPFHRPANTVHRTAAADASIVEPWRFYGLDTAACRGLLRELSGWAEPSGKVLNMLAAADALVQVTWLPDPGEAAPGQLFAATEENMEHIAAASAAVQSFLVAATARGLRTYWSSGGILRSPRLFAHLGIPARQILLGAVFVFPDADAPKVEVLAGKQRQARSPHQRWFRWVGSA